MLNCASLGVGQLYNQQPKKALCIICLVFILYISYFFAIATPTGILLVVVLALCLWLISIIDAAINAKGKIVELKWYNKWYLYVLICLSISILQAVSSLWFRKNLHETFKVSSVSMEPTLLLKDYIVVKKIQANQHAIKRGDLVLFAQDDDPTSPDVDESKISIVKRVIALPGETVEVLGNSVKINGIIIEEPYAKWSGGYSKDFSEQLVPKQKVFVLGDNRGYSKDSRYFAEPFISINNISGKVLYIYWSDKLDRIGKAL